MNVDVGCVEINQENSKKLLNRFKNIKVFSSIEESFKMNYDGYIISTPPKSHAKIAVQLLTNHKPILIEKPLALSVSECETIKEAIEKYEGKVLVGHLLLFHPAIVKIKSMIEDGHIGKIQYIYSNRLNLGQVRKEEDVLWSFAPHDISIFQYFTGSFPSRMSSVGKDFLQEDINDICTLHLGYKNGIQGHINVNWMHPFKEHRLVIIGTKGSFCFEDSNKNKQLLFYEKDFDKSNNCFSLKNKVPKKINFSKELPLKIELNYFLKVINGKTVEKIGFKEGFEVIKILEMASNKG